MKRFLPVVLIAALAGASAPSSVSAQNLAVAAHVGSLGIGGSVIYGASPRVNLRGTFGVIPSEPEFTVDEVDFTVDFPAFMRLTADFYPTGFFYLSGGMLFVSDGGDVNVVGTFTGTQEFDGTTYTAADVGDLLGTFSLKGAMPYLGVGFGNPVGGRVGLHLDLGVGIGEVPTVDLGATGPLASNATFQADLEAREAEFEADIPQALRYYPVISLALSVGLGG